MNEPKQGYWRRKPAVAPAKPDDDAGLWFFAGSNRDARDVSKPLVVDENGNPVAYAPRGHVLTVAVEVSPDARSGRSARVGRYLLREDFARSSWSLRSTL